MSPSRPRRRHEQQRASPAEKSAAAERFDRSGSESLLASSGLQLDGKPPSEFRGTAINGSLEVNSMFVETQFGECFLHERRFASLTHEMAFSPLARIFEESVQDD